MQIPYISSKLQLFFAFQPPAPRTFHATSLKLNYLIRPSSAPLPRVSFTIHTQPTLPTFPYLIYLLRELNKISSGQTFLDEEMFSFRFHTEDARTPHMPLE